MHFPNQTINNQQQSAGTFATRQRNRSGPTSILNAWKKQIYAVASKCAWNYFICEKEKQYSTNILSYVFFKTIPLCNYTILPATVKVSEGIPGSHCVKSFSALPSHS
jgi:hypothetical protein